MTRVTSYDEAVDRARSSDERLVEVEHAEAHAIVRMSDPETLNALSAPLTVQLHDRLRELAIDRSVRSIVLTGADPAFSAGGDLRLMRDAAHPWPMRGQAAQPRSGAGSAPSSAASRG